MSLGHILQNDTAKLVKGVWHANLLPSSSFAEASRQGSHENKGWLELVTSSQTWDMKGWLLSRAVSVYLAGLLTYTVTVERGEAGLYRSLPPIIVSLFCMDEKEEEERPTPYCYNNSRSAPSLDWRGQSERDAA